MSARNRRTGSSDLRRTKETKDVRATVRVYVEGKVTEAQYIYALSHEPDLSERLSVEFAKKGATPKPLVDAACQDKRSGAFDVDAYWCVFDVESPIEKQHPYLKDAVKKARDNGIEVAVSNPCFELWLVLHYQDQDSNLTTERAEHLRAELDGSVGKHLEGAAYMLKRMDAARRSERLRKKHQGDETAFPEDNPSTTFDLFVKDVEARARL